MLMTRLTIAASAALLISNAYGAGMMKAGLWEMKILHQEVDGKDMTAQISDAMQKAQAAMARMPPEQRAKMEAMMAGKGGPANLADAHRLCVSAEMAARDKPVFDPKSHCEPAKITRSGNTTTYELKCKTANGSMAGKGASTNNGDTVDTKMDITMTNASGTHKMVMESQLTYLGLDCQGIKPLDQIAEDIKQSSK